MTIQLILVEEVPGTKRSTKASVVLQIYGEQKQLLQKHSMTRPFVMTNIGAKNTPVDSK